MPNPLNKPKRDLLRDTGNGKEETLKEEETVVAPPPPPVQQEPIVLQVSQTEPMTPAPQPQQQQLIPTGPVVTSYPQERLPSPFPRQTEPLVPPEQPKQLPLMWCTPPTVEYLNCTFDQQNMKVTWYVSTRYIGAFQAISKLVYGNNKMTETVQEAIEDFIRKYADLLVEREDVVRDAEMQVRKKKKLYT